MGAAEKGVGAQQRIEEEDWKLIEEWEKWKELQERLAWQRWEEQREEEEEERQWETVKEEWEEEEEEEEDKNTLKEAEDEAKKEVEQKRMIEEDEDEDQLKSSKRRKLLQEKPMHQHFLTSSNQRSYILTDFFSDTHILVGFFLEIAGQQSFSSGLGRPKPARLNQQHQPLAPRLWVIVPEQRHISATSVPFLGIVYVFEPHKCIF